MDASMDLYIVLGVDHGATEAEIKRAYRRLARRFHPDINPGDQAAAAHFSQILAAYETLIDPARRSRYDSGHPVDEGHSPPGGGFEGFDFSTRGVDHSATFGDLFAEVLSERASTGPAPHRGADLHVDLRVSFEQSLAGVRSTIAVTRREHCRSCAGTGRTRMPAGTCLMCRGVGALRSVRGHMVFSRTCHVCDGTGEGRPTSCDQCAGTGQDTRSEAVVVRVPAGVADGDRLRVPEKGNAGTGGGPAGDLYVTVKVEPHALLRREGDDLHMTVDVAIHEAALGAKIEVRTLDGISWLRVPPGTQSGRRFRLRGHGATSTRTGERGDLVIETRIMLPKLLDERSKELLREFGRINTEPVRE